MLLCCVFKLVGSKPINATRQKAAIPKANVTSTNVNPAFCSVHDLTLKVMVLLALEGDFSSPINLYVAGKPVDLNCNNVAREI